jgi:hypothetical protein
MEQVEVLNKRLEGLKRAAQLLESEQAAIVELLQAGTGNGVGVAREMATLANVPRAMISPKPAATFTRRNAQVGSGKTRSGIRAASHDRGLTRLEMIAAALRRHPRRSGRELIALLEREYRWKTTESAVTGHLYTRPDKFVRTGPDRANNRPVT